MRPFDYIRNKFQREPIQKQPTPKGEADYLTSMQRDSTIAGSEAAQTNWDLDIGPPLKPRRPIPELTKVDFSSPNRRVSGQGPTMPGGQSFQPKTPPGYRGVNLSSVQSSEVTPDFGRNPLGEATRYPSISQRNETPDVVRRYLPSPERIGSERLTPQSKVSLQPDLSHDTLAANKSLDKQGFDTIGSPIQPTWRHKAELRNLPDEAVLPIHPVTRPTQSPPLTPQQNMEAELNQVRTEEIGWNSVGEPRSPRRFPITNDEV